MFEIYRETEYYRQVQGLLLHRVAGSYKETEINRAMAGEHFYDGFIKELSQGRGKEIIESLLPA